MTSSSESSRNWVEMAILCNMMVSPEICDIALAQLQEDYSLDERNRILFSAIKNLDAVKTGKRFEALLGWLNAQGLTEAAGGKAYIMCVYLFVPVDGIDGFVQLLIPKAA